MEGLGDWTKRGLFAAVLLFAASHGIAAWGADCTAATSGIDKAICADWSLSSQRARLDEDYGKALGMLSPGGQAALRADQMAWLRYRATACGFAGGGNREGDRRCLGRLLHRRDDGLLWLIVHQQRPSLFTYFVRSSYETTQDPAGGLPFWSESSIPQIDPERLSSGIAWSDAQAWNALIARLIGGPETVSVCPGGKGDIYREPHIYVASALLITVTEDRDDTCRGVRPDLVILRGPGAFSGLPQDHFMSETQYSIVMMRGDVHELKATDLFAAGDGWKRLLAGRVGQEIRNRVNRHHADWHPSADAIERVATDPSNWIPGGTAFSIRVNQSALSADEFTGGFTVTIPWSDLQGVLSFKGKRILSAPNW